MTNQKENNVLDPDVIDGITVHNGLKVAESQPQIIPEGKTLQRTQTQYHTAISVQKPRSLTEVLNKSLEEARLAGKAFYYGWTVKDRDTGKKIPIEGASVDLAMCVFRNYGNCVLDLDYEETNTHFIIKSLVIDLEKGITVPRLFRQRKKRALGKMDADRVEDMSFQIAQSKAQRNSILKSLPDFLVKKVMKEAKAYEMKKIENLVEKRLEAVKYFEEKYNISQDRLEYAIGKPVDQWTKLDLVEMRGTITAIQEERVTAEEAFPVVPMEPTVNNNGHSNERGRPGIYGHGDLIPPDQEPDKEKEEEPKKKAEPDPLDRKNWGRLKTPGYSTFVYNNLKVIKGCSDERLVKEMRDKWVDFYPQVSWPLDHEKTEGKTEEPPEVKDQEQPPAPGAEADPGKTEEKEKAETHSPGNKDELRAERMYYNELCLDNPSTVKLGFANIGLECNKKDQQDWDVADYREFNQWVTKNIVQDEKH